MLHSLDWRFWIHIVHKCRHNLEHMPSLEHPLKVQQTDWPTEQAGYPNTEAGVRKHWCLRSADKVGMNHKLPEWRLHNHPLHMACSHQQVYDHGEDSSRRLPNDETRISIHLLSCPDWQQPLMFTAHNISMCPPTHYQHQMVDTSQHVHT